MERELRFPRDASFDRNYWLCRCEGFRVEAGERVLGIVTELRYRRFHDLPDELVVVGGLLGVRTTLVAVEDVLEVLPRQLRLRVRAAPERPSMLAHLLARIHQLVDRGARDPAGSSGGGGI